jgi:DNA-binding HxlR family transcriptional regulator
MPRVTTKVLRAQLREMVADDLIAREDLVRARPAGKYLVTPYGRSLEPVFETLWRWGTQHLAREGASCGTLVTAPVSAR